jgi:FMN phosphatase YigB (HAD superfamily)
MLFDLWGTLIDAEGPGESQARDARRRQMTADALARSGHTYAPHHMAEAFSVAGTELARVHSDGRDLTAEGRTILYLRHLDPSLADKLDDAAWERLHRALLTPALSNRPSIIPGALEALRDVRALGVPIGLISNAGITPGFVLREIMEGHGLLEYFAHTIFSDEVELSKPTTAIFEIALDEFGVAPEEAAFLGDQPVLDVLGPQSAGIWSIQVGDITAAGIDPHIRIETLAGLVPALRTRGLIAEPTIA